MHARNTFKAMASIARRATLLASLAILATGCSDPVVTHELAGQTMGTTYSVQIVSLRSMAPDTALRDEISATLRRIEARLSTYLPTSEVSLFNNEPADRWFPVAYETCALVQRAKAWSLITDGAFDITVAPVVDAWGFGPAAAPDRLPTREQIAALMPSVSHVRLATDCNRPAILKLTEGVRIDLSGFAKGYAVDAVAELLDEKGYGDYLVEVGGELRGAGRNERQQGWRIAIENPVAVAAAPAGIVSLNNQAMATSGDYRNFLEFDDKRYSHTIDPRTGWPIDHALTAVTVIMESAADADALATALLVLGPERGLSLAERLEIAARLMLRNGDGYTTRDSAAFSADPVEP